MSLGTTKQPEADGGRFVSLTQAEIATMQGVSRTMIQHIEKRAIRKMRQAIEREARAERKTVREWLFGD